MRVVFLRSFEKDLDRIEDRRIRQRVMAQYEEMLKAGSLVELRGLKKLVGHRDAFRVRIGDHRLGFFFREGTIELARILHRKDIYRMFP